MDVKEYSQKLDQARDKYRTAQEDLKSSYEKNTESMKESFDRKIKDRSENYDAQRSKLEEQNQVSSELYSDKTKQAISKAQEDFRNEIKSKSLKFDAERNAVKNNFSEKLNDLSESYKKSADEKDLAHQQSSKLMNERYTNSNHKYKNDFEKQLDRINTESRDDISSQKANFLREKAVQEKTNLAEMENLRATSEESKFKAVSKLNKDNENLRTNIAEEREFMHQHQNGRIADILSTKSKESEEMEKNISNLQKNMYQKNLAQEKREKAAHQEEAKKLESKFNEDIRNVQRLTNQKLEGGTEISKSRDENKQLVESYENRLKAAREENQKTAEADAEKAKLNDLSHREELKSFKLANREEAQKHDFDLTTQFKQNFQDAKNKSNSLIDRYKSEVTNTKLESDQKLGKSEIKSKDQLNSQRVEFGKFLNVVNDNKMEEISSIKSEFKKDKSNLIEKTKKDLSEEKATMRADFDHQSRLRDEMYERKLSEMENQTNKIIENYENKIAQIARKAENHVDSMKTTTEQHRAREEQANKIAYEFQEKKHREELGNLRDKYEHVIGKDRALNEQQINRIVQKYEDQLNHERAAGQKEVAMQSNEAKAQVQRLYNAAEQEKANLRNQYEQRIENIRLANLSAEGSKKV